MGEGDGGGGGKGEKGADIGNSWLRVVDGMNIYIQLKDRSQKGKGER